jgi:hypothetical protein
MASGYAPYILKDFMAAPNMKQNWKVDARGLTNLLYTGKGASPIRNTEDTGEKREIRHKYRQRFTKAQVDNAYACDQVLTPARNETTLTATNVAQIAIHLPYDLLKNYEKEATSATRFNGVTATNELMDLVASGANAVLETINEKLQTLIVWGKNTGNSGSAAAQTITIPALGTTVTISDGIAKVMSDYKVSGLTSVPNFIMGPGKPFQYLQYAHLTSGAQNSGFDNRLATQYGDWYLDMDYTADGFAAFEPGSIQIVEYLENLFKPGRLGVSEFFTGMLPMGTDPLGNQIPVPFDFQLREIDCPTTLYDAYTGSSATYNRGHSLIIWKNYGLFQTPTDNFRGEDMQNQVNGALRFTMANA